MSIFIRLTVVAFQNREIRGNSDIIGPYSSSRSSKATDLSLSGMLTCDFLLVTIVTLALSATVFEILTLKTRKSLNFSTPPFFEAPLREPLRVL